MRIKRCMHEGSGRRRRHYKLTRRRKLGERGLLGRDPLLARLQRQLVQRRVPRQSSTKSAHAPQAEAQWFEATGN